MVATPHEVLPRDSHYMGPALGGATQDTDFNKGFTKEFFTTNLRRRNGGGQGDPDLLMVNKQLIRSAANSR